MSKILKISIKHNHISIIEWIIKKRLLFWKYIIIQAINNSSQEIINMVFSNGYKIGPTEKDDPNICHFAAITGNLDMLKFIINKGFPPNKTICNSILKSGNIEMLEYAISLGYNYNSEATSIAAKFGHINMLKWLHSKNCTFNEWAFVEK